VGICKLAIARKHFVLLIVSLVLVPLVILGSLISQFSFFSHQTNSVSSEEAAKDGFEVIVLEKKGDKLLSARSMDIEAASRLVLTNSAFTFFLPYDKVGAIEEMVVKSEHVVHDFIRVAIESTPNREQLITLSFHYGNKTYRYNYRASEGDVVPVWSSYSSLAGTKKTIYEKRKKEDRPNRLEHTGK
jgi:hypothetical protein